MQLSELGELKLIERITRELPKRSDVAVGAGDDCAVVSLSGTEDLVLTTDPVVEGVHFETGTSGESIGRKALGRVLSDLAAMGSEPRWALINVVAPDDTELTVIDGIYQGLNQLAGQFNAAVVGGDVTRGSVLELHVFGVGTVPRGKAVLRSGANAGDRVFVTGYLGGSRLGRHLQVEPRVNDGIFLRDRASAMIDVSDGLVGDLCHLADMSGVGVMLNLEQIPVSEAAGQMAADGVSALEHALYDGEDFELLFTIAPEQLADFERAWKQHTVLKCTEIGIVTEKAEGICISDNKGVRPIDECRHGFEHFR
jgi:thiamine-monophosphate kinase